jgi:hypothetical protein
MEEIKNTSFASLYTTSPSPCPSGCFCNGDTFYFDVLASGDGKGLIEISDDDAVNHKRKLVRINSCFPTTHNRWIDSCNIDDADTWNSKIVTFIAR